MLACAGLRCQCGTAAPQRIDEVLARMQPRCMPSLASSGSSFTGLGPRAAPYHVSSGTVSRHVSSVGVTLRARASTAPARAEPSEDSIPRSFSAREAAHKLAGMDDWADALATFEQFRERAGFAPEAIHYNILLKLLGAAGEWQRAEKLFLEMEASPEEGLCRPDNYTFSTLISCAVRLEQYDLALGWIERMAGTVGCYPDQVTYSTIIHALGKAGQPGEALRVFRKMVSAGWDLDFTTYGTVLSLYVNAREYSAAGELFAKLQEAGLPLSEGVYNCMLQAYRDQGASAKAMELFNEMQDGGVPASALTYSLLLAALAKAGEFRAMMDYFQRAQAAGMADAGVFNSVINAHRLHGNLAAAAELYREMVACGVPGSGATYRLVMSVFSELGEADQVAAAKQALDALGVPMDIRGYSNMIQGFARAQCWDALEGVVAEMRSNGIEADAQLTCILLSLMAQSVPREAGEPGVYRSQGELAAGVPFERPLWCLEQLNSVASWELVSGVQEAQSEGKKESGIGAMARELLGGVEARSQKVTCNCVLDLLWAMGRLEDALAVWEAGRAVGLYADVFPKHPFVPARRPHGGNTKQHAKWTPSNLLGQLDLRQLSVGAAHVALFDWLGRLDKALLSGHRLPKTATIAVGRGHFRRSTGKVGPALAMREQIHETLEAIYAPFTFDPADPRMLVAHEEELTDFLDSEWGIQFLELCGSQPFADPPSSPDPTGEEAETSSETSGTDSEPGSLQPEAELQGASSGSPASDVAAVSAAAAPVLDEVASSAAEGESGVQGQGSLSGRIDGFAATIGDVRSRLAAFKAEIDGLAAHSSDAPQDLQSSAAALAPDTTGAATPGLEPVEATTTSTSKGASTALTTGALEVADPQEETLELQRAGGAGAGETSSTSVLAEGGEEDWEEDLLISQRISLDGQYWEMDGFGGWQGPEGWMKKCRCGKVWNGRKRKCECSLALPTKEAVKAGGTCQRLE